MWGSAALEAVEEESGKLRVKVLGIPWILALFSVYVVGKWMAEVVETMVVREWEEGRAYSKTLPFDGYRFALQSKRSKTLRTLLQ